MSEIQTVAKDDIYKLLLNDMDGYSSPKIAAFFEMPVQIIIRMLKEMQSDGMILRNANTARWRALPKSIWPVQKRLWSAYENDKTHTQRLGENDP
jgi:hypothetical protein